jgi:hypothetical protein
MASVALVGPVEATASAGAMAMGAAIDFALGPIGLIVAALGLMTYGVMKANEEVRQSKIAHEAATRSATELKTATDDYAEAALKASMATGKDRQSAEDAARQMKVLAQQKLDEAKASLAAAQASLAHAQALNEEFAAAERLKSGNPMSPFGATSSGGGLNPEALRINKAQADIKVYQDALNAAAKSIANSDAVIAAGGHHAAEGITETGNAAAKAAPGIDNLDQALKSVMDALATPDERAESAFADQVKVLNAALRAGKITADQYADSVRRARQAMKDESFTPVSPVKPEPQIVPIEQTDAYKAAEQMAADTERMMTQAWQNIGYAAKNVLKDVIETGRVDWKSLIDFMIDHLGDVMKVLGSVWNAARSGGGGIGSTLSAIWNAIPHNANGTDNWPGGLSWVGERGPELLNVPRGGQIIPNHGLAALGGGDIAVHVIPSPYFDVQVQRVASPMIARASAQAVVGGADMAQVKAARVQRATMPDL